MTIAYYSYRYTAGDNFIYYPRRPMEPRLICCCLVRDVDVEATEYIRYYCASNDSGSGTSKQRYCWTLRMRKYRRISAESLHGPLVTMMLFAIDMVRWDIKTRAVNKFAFGIGA